MNKDMMMGNLVKNATHLKQMMEDPAVDTGDDVEAFAREYFKVGPGPTQQLASGKPPQQKMDPMEANRNVLARYRSYFGD